MSLRHLALAAVCAAAVSAPAFADTTVTLLHVSEDKNAQALWGQIAKDYEAAHPGVKVEVKYLENEAFKAKLPTMLQADDSRPSLFYTWGGGVMDVGVHNLTTQARFSLHSRWKNDGQGRADVNASGTASNGAAYNAHLSECWDVPTSSTPFKVVYFASDLSVVLGPNSGQETSCAYQGAVYGTNSAP